MLKVVQVQPLAGYKLRLRYADGVEGEVDLSHLVGKGVFSLWSDPGGFDRVSIGPSGEVRWNDQIDLCPDALYMQITGESAVELFPNLRGSLVNSAD